MGRKAINLTGQRFGKLTVLQRIEGDKSGRVMWECRCDCGTSVRETTGRLRGKNGVKQCKHCSDAGMTKDITGQRFGRLTVLRKDEVKHPKQEGAWWVCQCDCGNVVSVFGGALRYGSKKSCGCGQGVHVGNKGQALPRYDLTGERFGRLTVIRRDDSVPVGEPARWICKCDCGNEKSIGASMLRKGFTKSCGCLRKEKTSARMTTHGMSKTRFWGIWQNMIHRCEYPSVTEYNIYGGRGISVCERWHDFTNFYNDMFDGYSDELTIDRIDNDGNYEPSNCRWSTPSEQCRNRRTNVYVTFQGKRMLQTDWAREKRILDSSAYDYLRRHRLDGTILIEGGANDNTKEMQGRSPVWEQSV